ncbi:hypothetical protein K7X08_012619 [Anisodus acutangulus]|uniref:Uncharacterized protein n=1 Tax=Anisodus acutangulus TaxID=402998 RepID=A0A9Q1RFV0_9SOLA|nr:hypothetical protein K7X08_012619 [Anisodus acutangulus]
MITFATATATSACCTCTDNLADWLSGGARCFIITIWLGHQILCFNSNNRLECLNNLIATLRVYIQLFHLSSGDLLNFIDWCLLELNGSENECIYLGHG